MILILRGHIRNSFNTKDLYHFIKQIYDAFPELKIVIHTWNIFSNNLSWRNIEVNNQPVNETVIHEYFEDLCHLIKHIIIDDDTKIQLNGNLSGYINHGPMPILGWKNYWYGKYRIIEYLHNIHTDENEMIVNCRFDIQSNSNNYPISIIMHLLKHETKFTKNIFLFTNEHNYGIDNIYIGNIHTMYTLIHSLHMSLDNILSKHNNDIHQEILVYRINEELFK